MEFNDHKKGRTSGKMDQMSSLLVEVSFYTPCASTVTHPLCASGKHVGHHAADPAVPHQATLNTANCKTVFRMRSGALHACACTNLSTPLSGTFVDVHVHNYLEIHQ